MTMEILGYGNKERNSPTTCKYKDSNQMIDQMKFFKRLKDFCLNYCMTRQ